MGKTLALDESPVIRSRIAARKNTSRRATTLDQPSKPNIGKATALRKKLASRSLPASQKARHRRITELQGKTLRVTLGGAIVEKRKPVEEVREPEPTRYVSRGTWE